MDVFMTVQGLRAVIVKEVPMECVSQAKAPSGAAIQATEDKPTAGARLETEGDGKNLRRVTFFMGY
jgi:hypothetical protein